MNISLTDTTAKSESTLRSLVGFDWKTKCFICSKQAIVDIRHKDRNDVQEVPTPQICANALKKCNQRNYGFARSVYGRLQIYIDVVAEEAVYHRACYQMFLSNERESNPVGWTFKGTLMEI